MDILFVVFFCTFKFAITFPIAILQFDFSYMEAIGYGTLGGVIGVIAFMFFSELIFYTWKIIKEKTGISLLKRNQELTVNKRKRRFILFKQKYGFWGIIITTPIILSIPIGVILAMRYYSDKKKIFFWMSLSLFVWANIYSVLLIFFKDSFMWLI